MENKTPMFVGRRARHQQRRDTTIALRNHIELELLTARDAAEDLDLEVTLRNKNRHHIRVSEISNGLLKGVFLSGFRYDSPRVLGDPAVIRVDAILTAARIGTEARP